MFSILRKSLSGESQASQPSTDELESNQASGIDSSSNGGSDSRSLGKQLKRNRSGDLSQNVSSASEQAPVQKKKRLSHSKNTTASALQSLEKEEEVNLGSLPPETPQWGMRLLEIIPTEFSSVNTSISMVEEENKGHSTQIAAIETRLNAVKECNKVLENENNELKEKLLELEYHQRRSNLIFEGILDGSNESDLQCIEKL